MAAGFTGTLSATSPEGQLAWIADAEVGVDDLIRARDPDIIETMCSGLGLRKDMDIAR